MNSYNSQAGEGKYSIQFETDNNENYVYVEQACRNCIDNKLIYMNNKEIPQKPILEGDGYFNGELVYDTWICPNCGKDYELDYEEHDYCPNCGKHIDWSEVE